MLMLPTLAHHPLVQLVAAADPREEARRQFESDFSRPDAPARSYDSVILKTLGATRGQLLLGQALEYGLLATILAGVALGLGSLAAWTVIVQIFDFRWAPDWSTVLATLGGGALLTLGIGLAGSLPLLSLRPARALRQM